MSLYNELVGVENGVNGLSNLVPNHDFNNRVLKALRVKKSRIWTKIGAVCGGAWLVTMLAFILSPLSSDVFSRVLSSSPAIVRFLNKVQFIGSTLTRVFSPLAKSQFNPSVFVLGGIINVGMFFIFGKFLRKKETICTA
jgi:uncharacterized membrane protein